MDIRRIKRAAEAVDPQQLALGKETELEHGTKNPETNVTDDDPQMTELIARAHLNEDPQYYTHLRQMEAQHAKRAGEEEEEAGGVPVTEEVVREWLQRNPNPEDSAVHRFAQAHGYNKHALEEVIYRLATAHAKEAAYDAGVLRALVDMGLVR